MDQLLSEPAGQRLTHPVEQLGQLNVVIPVVFPEERLGLKRKWKKKRKKEKRGELNWWERNDRRCNVPCERFVPQGPFQGTGDLYFSLNTWSSLPPAADTRSLSWDQT